MEMVLGFLVMLGCLLFGVHHGGIGLAVISGIGLAVYTFVFGYQPGVPPISVMLTILAVVTCAGFLQTSGGLTVMLKYAERLLRNNPKQVTIFAPVTTWLLTVLCGTGHVVYTMFPIIYDVAIKQGIRPERPMAVSSVAAQMGICGSPVSVAVVSIIAFMAQAGHHVSVLQVLGVTIPATLTGVVCAALWSYRRGKDLEKDEAFQEFIKDPKNKEYVYGDSESLQGQELPRSYYHAMFIFFFGILVIAILGNDPDLLPHFPDKLGQMKAIDMTEVIQMIMLLAGAVILLTCKVDGSKINRGPVYRSGMTAIFSVFGVAWMTETFMGAHIKALESSLSRIMSDYPWTYAIILFVVGKLVNSQAAALLVIAPLGLQLGVDPVTLVGFYGAAYGYFVLPTYPSDLAAIGFDRTGTTHIGKYIINHSFLVPGFICVITSCLVGTGLAHILLGG